jgi:prepilin-type N-terminal cleavage/methylation domain-containing protein/prepilin-type processing-associated H-X9-DG protein
VYCQASSFRALLFRFRYRLETNIIRSQPIRPMARNSHFARAFTLVEVIVVLAIIAILMSLVYPMYTSISERAKATKDMSNLRQIGLATQTYLNDSDGVLFSTAAGAGTWMAQLHPKYLPAWHIFQSPFDTRPSSELDASAPISYGLNGNPGSGLSIAGLLANKITNPSVFIMFAPAQAAGPRVAFAGGTAAAVTVYKNTNPAASGGTHNNRQRINALFADLHSENMAWTTFINDTPSPSDPSAALRWSPYIPYP